MNKEIIFSRVTFLSSEFIEIVLITFVGIVFITFSDTLSAACMISLHIITEVSTILFKNLLSHKYMCYNSNYNFFCRCDTFYTHIDM